MMTPPAFGGARSLLSCRLCRRREEEEGGEGERDRSLDLRDPLFRRSSVNRTDDFVSDRTSRAGEFFLRVESLLFLEPREDRSGGEAERDREGDGERDRGCLVSPRPHDRD